MDPQNAETMQHSYKATKLFSFQKNHLNLKKCLSGFLQAIQLGILCKSNESLCKWIFK